MLQALWQVRLEMIKEVQKVQSILTDNTAIGERINQFAYGHIVYHLCIGRYWSGELDIPAAHGARKLFEELANVTFFVQAGKRIRKDRGMENIQAVGDGPETIFHNP